MSAGTEEGRPGRVDLTVAICSRDRRQMLLTALESLQQQRAPIPWEVLVVDNASRDDTSDAVEELSSQFPVPLRVAREEQPGLSFARNHALAESRGDIVVFADDDVGFRPGFVRAHHHALEDTDVAASGGRILPVLPAQIPDWIAEFLAREIGGPSARYDFGEEPLEVGAETGRPLPFGANLGLRRHEARAIGGFRTDLGWGRSMIPGEETDLLRRLETASRRIVYVPTACVDHHIAVSKLDETYLIRWYRGFGRSSVLIDPPAGFFEHTRLAIAALRKMMTWELRKRRPGRSGEQYGLALRKAAKAQGRFLQLLHSRPKGYATARGRS